jgi:hypothetical protein
MSTFETLEQVQRHEETLRNAKKLMTLCSENFSHPVDALMAMVLGSATLAHGIGMTLPHLLEGIEAAYSDLSTQGDEHGTH